MKTGLIITLIAIILFSIYKLIQLNLAIEKVWFYSLTIPTSYLLILFLNIVKPNNNKK